MPETDFDNDRGRVGKRIRLTALKGMDRGTIAERLGGEMLRIGGDQPGNAAQQERRNSDAEECAFFGDLPGDFRITIDLAARGNGAVNGPTRSNSPCCVASRSAARTFTTGWRRLPTSACFSIWFAPISAAKSLAPIKRKSSARGNSRSPHRAACRRSREG